MPFENSDKLYQPHFLCPCTYQISWRTPGFARNVFPSENCVDGFTVSVLPLILFWSRLSHKCVRLSPLSSLNLFSNPIKFCHQIWCLPFLWCHTASNQMNLSWISLVLNYCSFCQGIFYFICLHFKAKGIPQKGLQHDKPLLLSMLKTAMKN